MVCPSIYSLPFFSDLVNKKKQERGEVNGGVDNKNHYIIDDQFQFLKKPFRISKTLNPRTKMDCLVSHIKILSYLIHNCQELDTFLFITYRSKGS